MSDDDEQVSLDTRGDDAEPPGADDVVADDVVADVGGAPPPAAGDRDADSPRAYGFADEKPPLIEIVSRRQLARQTRRDFLLFGAGASAVAAGLVWSLPQRAAGHLMTPPLAHWLDSIEARTGGTPERKEAFFQRVLGFDDDVAEALFSPSRSVRMYRKSDVTSLRNNYSGATPSAGILAGWSLRLSGLAAGRDAELRREDLLRFPHREQVTRLCCVEGWSAIAWWGGLRFSDLIAAFPPLPGARWVALESAVSLGGNGRPDPYYVSIDLATARHAQTLLVTHQNGRDLTLPHGAPLRLLVPMKLGLKNIKAITSITYTASEPRDYWAERGYSRYDGL